MANSINAELPSKERLADMLNTLFPLPRTLVSQGYDRSLDYLAGLLPLTVNEYASGTPAWDWTVPNEWNVIEAWIETADGERLIDYRDHNLRLSAYSLPFDGMVSRKELLDHLCYSKRMPRAIPYNTLYYARNWQFNVSKEEYDTRFTAEQYRVRIAIDEKPGTLKIGEFFLPGFSDQEIVVSTYMCHPSMANDNLSGVVTAIELFRLLAQMPKRHYSYRLLILPETIGAIAYLAHRSAAELARIVGGYVVYICGDPGPLHYKRSYAGNGVIDFAAERAMQQRSRGRVRPFEPFGSDERQYNAPGVRLNFGAVTRSPPSEFPEYHTSADDLDFVSVDALVDTASYLLDTVRMLEINRRYENLYKGEPFFSRHGIQYPTFHNSDNYLRSLDFKRIAYEIDGTNDVFAIADKLGLSVEEVHQVIAQFVTKGLVRLIA